MRTVPRTRHYVSGGALTLCRPVLAFDYAREAYILRGIGNRVGPVLRENRRRRGRGAPQSVRYPGPERRGAALTERSRRQPAAVETKRSERRGATAAGSPASGDTMRRPRPVGQTRSKASRRSRPKRPPS